ncbi:serine hydrolase domain-containing protein [Tenacibaculum amylolyticum]|uniref:serine hydrolase domain-containing protein n=1 Tax=Tenacibaculum amylolyticum TaxID=104269 RepID=UPI003894C977
MRKCSFLFVLLLLSNISFGQQTQFTKELESLQHFFSIPGMTAAITQNNKLIYEQHFGYADLETKTLVNANTIFPVASITKLFTATLIMKLAAQGKLVLNDPISLYIPNSKLDKQIQIQHLLSHTSQGTIGKQFFYSVRFSLLTQIIEKATGKPFNEVMNSEILTPLKLTNTFLLKNKQQLTQAKETIATPYVLGNGVEKGFIDYGYSTSAGLVSNTKDLLQFSKALDQNSILSTASKNKLLQGIDNDLPYAFGIFKQRYLETDIFWIYGQYDCYSSLLLKVPSKKLTLVLLANNNLMSDPARLIMGDVTSSLFAMSFLKNYVLNSPQTPLLETAEEVYTNNATNTSFYRKKVLAQALANSFMARFDLKHFQTSKVLLEKTFEKHPNYLAYTDINLLHTLVFLKDVAFYKKLPPFTQFDTQIEHIGTTLLKETPNDPYLHSYMATFYDRNGNLKKAKQHYKTIVTLPNFSSNWYTKDAAQWLEEHP